MVATVSRLGGRRSTRERIVGTAGSLFAQRGFYGASIGALAAALGVAKASVMHHFGSKDALYDEVVARIAETVHRPLQAELHGARDERDAMRRTIRVLVEWSESHPDYTKLIVRNLLDNSREMSSARWHFTPVVADMIAVIERGQRAGCVRPGAALLLLEMLLGMAFYHVLARPTQSRIVGVEAAQALQPGMSDRVCALLEVALLVEPPGD